MKKSKIILVSAILAFAFTMYSCYRDNEEYLYPTITNCDTTNVTYSKSLVKTLTTYCYGCHGTSYATDGNGIRLNNYKDLVSYLDRVIGAMKHSPKNSAMPKNSGKLNDCLVNQFVTWKNSSTPNN